MPAQGRLHRHFPYIARVERVSDIVIGWPVGVSEIVGILLTQRTAKRNTKQNAVGHFIKCMAVRVVWVKKSLSPPRELMLERNNHAVVVGHGICIDLRNP